jgi:hypothetical protein
MIEVPYLTEEQIEARAEALLSAYSRDREPILRPPVPLDDKILYFLGLRLHMDDLHARFGIPRIAGRVDILAALKIEDREILVDESLDPEMNPEAEGPFLFSIGHEIAHWELHRHEIAAASAVSLLMAQPRSLAVCRNLEQQLVSGKQNRGTRLLQQIRLRMEVQANAFGACLLMPRTLVLAAWRNRFHNLDPVFVEDRTRSGPQLPLSLPRAHPTLNPSAKCVSRPALKKLVADIATEFCASRHATRIRLRKLGLVLP